MVMVEGHVVNSYLPHEFRRQALFSCLDFFNGLITAVFLFTSGFSIILQGSRLWDDWLHFRLALWKQMRRLGFILMVGYYLHLYGFRFSAYLRNPQLWRETLQVDILQCIVTSLLFVHLLIFVFRRRTYFVWGAVACAVLFALITPWMWAQDFAKHLPLSLALFLNPHGISLFPLFPWICFVLSGSVVSHFFLQSVREGIDTRLMPRIAVLGVLLVAAGLLGRMSPFSLPGYQSFHTTSPLYVMIRLGCVLLMCIGLWALEKYLRWIPKPIRLRGKSRSWFTERTYWLSFLCCAGRESDRSSDWKWDTSGVS